MRYILNSDTITLTPPSGLSISLNDFGLGGTGSIQITDINSGVYTIPGANPLPMLFTDTVVIVASGTVSIELDYVGDQRPYRLFDENIKTKNAGRYPGVWGNSIGSIPRSSVDDAGYHVYPSGFQFEDNRIYPSNLV